MNINVSRFAMKRIEIDNNFTISSYPFLRDKVYFLKPQEVTRVNEFSLISLTLTQKRNIG